MSLRKIAEEVGCAVNTVRRHLDDENPPRYDRKKLRVTKLSPFEEYLRERQVAALSAWIPASVLLREIIALGYTGGGSQLRAYMHGLKRRRRGQCRRCGLAEEVEAETVAWRAETRRKTARRY